MSYIVTADITDAVVKPFLTSHPADWATYLTLTGNALVDMAEAKGVCSTSIATPLHTMVKDWAVAWFCARACKDHLEQANIEAGIEDKYTVKYRLYEAEHRRLYNQISAEMLQKTVAYPVDRIQFGTVYVG